MPTVARKQHMTTPGSPRHATDATARAPVATKTARDTPTRPVAPHPAFLGLVQTLNVDQHTSTRAWALWMRVQHVLSPTDTANPQPWYASLRSFVPRQDLVLGSCVTCACFGRFACVLYIAGNISEGGRVEAGEGHGQDKDELSTAAQPVSQSCISVTALLRTLNMT